MCNPHLTFYPLIRSVLHIGLYQARSLGLWTLRCIIRRGRGLIGSVQHFIGTPLHSLLNIKRLTPPKADSVLLPKSWEVSHSSTGQRSRHTVSMNQSSSAKSSVDILPSREHVPATVQALECESRPSTTQHSHPTTTSPTECSFHPSLRTVYPSMWPMTPSSYERFSRDPQVLSVENDDIYAVTYDCYVVPHLSIRPF